MEYDYIKHTVTQLGKTCKRLKDHYDVVTTDITITPSIICIIIEAAVKERHLEYNDFKCAANRAFYVYYSSDNLTEYMFKLKRRLNQVEKELDEYRRFKLSEWYRTRRAVRVSEHSEKDINNAYGKSVTEDNNENEDTCM